MPRRIAAPPETAKDEERRERRRRAPDAAAVAKIRHEAVNEQVLIAAAAVDPPTRARLSKALPADGFHAKGHSAIWAGLCELDRRALHYDPATLRAIDPSIDIALVETIVAQRPALPPNLQFHVEAFLWDHRRVQVAQGPLASLVEALQDPASDVGQIQQLARVLGRSFDGSSSLRYLRDPEAVTASARARLAQRRARFAEGHVCYPYGIPGLDFYEDGRPRLIPGMEPRQMTLVVGVSGNGKTTVTNQIALAQANDGQRILHGAWEQDGETNLQMLAGYSLAIPRARLWTGDLSDEETKAIEDEMDRLGGGERPLVRFFELPFDRRRKDRRDQGRVSLNDLNLDLVHEHVEGAGCSIAIFDLVAKAIVETKPDEEKRALDRLFGIAKETNSHFIALHHLNKGDVDKRPDKAPTRDAIKGGTHWIDAFDTILGTHIPGVWKDVPKDTLEIRVLKQRYGEWPLAVELAYDALTGIVSGGKEIPYDQGDDRRGVDNFLDVGEPEREQRPARRRR